MNRHRPSAAVLLVAVLLSSCQSAEPVASKPPLPPPISTKPTPIATDEHPSTELLIRPPSESPRLPEIRISPPLWNQFETLSPPGLKTPSWTEPAFTAHPPELLLKESPPLPEFCPPTSRALPLQVRHPEIPSLPQPDLSLALSNPLTPESLKFQPEGAKLRPRSPYCMPGHTSQNFVLYSVHDGLPLHPGVW